MVPGSHKRRCAPDPAGEYDDGIQLKIRMGDIIVFHGATWHASGANRTERGRMILLGFSAAALLRNRSRTDSGWRSPKSSSAPRRRKRLPGFDSQSGLRT